MAQNGNAQKFISSKSVTIKKGSVYDYPKLYDLLFTSCNKRELAFLEYWINRLGLNAKGPSPVALFEPACGTGRLLWQLAKKGYDAVGLDLNEKALQYCNDRFKRHGLPENAFQGDMADFQLADLRRKKRFDIAFNMVSSFLHLTCQKQALSHLNSVSRVLKAKGIYILCLHLRHKEGIPSEPEIWTVQRGFTQLKSHLHTLYVQKKKRIEQVEFRFHVKTTKEEYQVIDEFPLRIYTAKQIRDLIHQSPFRILETYDFLMDPKEPIQMDHETEDVVFVLKKT